MKPETVLIVSLWSREQLQYASKTDSASLAEEVLGNPKLGDDVNKQDGLGMTGMAYDENLPLKSQL